MNRLLVCMISSWRNMGNCKLLPCGLFNFLPPFPLPQNLFNFLSKTMLYGCQGGIHGQPCMTSAGRYRDNLK